MSLRTNNLFLRETRTNNLLARPLPPPPQTEESEEAAWEVAESRKNKKKKAKQPRLRIIRCPRKQRPMDLNPVLLRGLILSNFLNLASKEGKIKISWTKSKIELLKNRQSQCYKCWGLGHLRDKCTSAIDRSRTCFRCGAEGHAPIRFAASFVRSKIRTRITVWALLRAKLT